MKKNHSIIPIAGLALLVVSTSLNADTPAPAAAAAPAASSTQTGDAQLPPDLAAALQLPAGPDQNKALGAAARTWGIQDPLAAFAWMMPLPQAQFGAVGGGIANGAGGSANPKAAGDWLVQQTSPRTNLLIHGFMLGWGAKDATAAEAWSLQVQGNRDYRYIAIFTMGDALSRKKGADAGAWALTLPAGDDRNAAIDGAVTIWIRGDIPGMTAWIKQLNPTDMKWAGHIAARNWRSKDLTLAAWLDQTPLSADDKAEILKGPQPDSFHISLYQPTSAAAPSKP